MKYISSILYTEGGYLKSTPQSLTVSYSGGGNRRYLERFTYSRSNLRLPWSLLYESGFFNAG